MTYQERLFRQTHGYGCEPTTILAVSSLAISAAGAVATAQGQKYAADAQADQQRQLVAANNSNADEQISQLRIQQAQNAESVARDNERARLAAQRSKASATVAAGEAGVTGNSVDALLGEYDAQLGQYREATLRQRQLNDQGANTQIDAIRTGTRYQNLQINAPISGPNYAAIGLGFLKDSLGTYKAYNPDAFTRTPSPKK